MNRMIVCIPCRGRSQFLPSLLEKLSQTKTDRSTIIVVSNGSERFADPGLDGIYVVHIGNVPTIAVAVNFCWYAMATPGCILVKIDNDMDIPEKWEQTIYENSRVVSAGGFLIQNLGALTPLISLGGQTLREAYMSETWGMPFIYGGFNWLGPALADILKYHDERFIRSSDGDLGERMSRVPGAIAAYSADQMCVHLSPSFESSTESESMVRDMYEASDRLIKVLPPRDIEQPTIWQHCLSREEAANLVRSRGTLSIDMELKARRLLREKLEVAYEPIGWKGMVECIFRDL